MLISKPVQTLVNSQVFFPYMNDTEQLIILEAHLEEARAVVDRYEGWWEDSPEDSWRFERDIRAALGMAEASER